ncbi:hypothetical protein ACJX0J_027411, partial [Zea mays]
ASTATSIDVDMCIWILVRIINNVLYETLICYVGFLLNIEIMTFFVIQKLRRRWGGGHPCCLYGENNCVSLHKGLPFFLILPIFFNGLWQFLKTTDLLYIETIEFDYFPHWKNENDLPNWGSIYLMMVLNFG